TQVTMRSCVCRVSSTLIAVQIVSSATASPRLPTIEILRAIEPPTFTRSIAYPRLLVVVERRTRSVQLVHQAHFGAGHQTFDVHQDQHALGDAADAGDEAGVDRGRVQLGRRR